MRRQRALGIALLAASLSGAWASDTPSRLDQATVTFADGDYSHAIVLLREIVLDPADAKDKAEAHFWLAKSYLAVDNLEDGERSLEFFLSNYPDHPRYAEAFYEKGRLLYRQGDHENAILVLQAFLDRYPDSTYVPNAYFWIGEALYSLGQLDDAMLAFRKVVDAYPSSFRVEPARYRIALIDFKKRENELLKLLKWSHEESLRTIEAFQRRETAYEQALAAYQKRIAAYEQADLQKTVDALQRNVAERDAKITELTAALAQATEEADRLKDEAAAAAAASAAASAGAPGPSTATAAPAQQGVAELLALKAAALKLKESLLQWTTANAGTP